MWWFFPHTLLEGYDNSPLHLQQRQGDYTWASKIEACHRNDIYKISKNIVKQNHRFSPESCNNPIGRVDEMLAVRSRSQKARPWEPNPRHQGYLAAMEHGWEIPFESMTSRF